MSDELGIERLIASILDDEPVDWDAAWCSAATDEDRVRIDALRGIAQVVAFNHTQWEQEGPPDGAIRSEAVRLGAAATLPPGSELLAGQTIGAYTLESPLGAGGMGTVWLARRSDGRFEGRVAIKLPNVPRLGRDGLIRFEREGQILARLRHPSIAQLFDAGVTPEGQPYLVLEHVDGVTIDHHCDALGLDVRARVALFMDVLGAVAHAQSNLVLHRDLKPSNILVDKSGAVKLLDFGIAKLLDDESDPASETQLTQRAGHAFTPEFAAPEQLQCEPVTTATDVYAAGVVLYALLTGLHPTGSVRGSLLERMKVVLESDPKPASVAVSAEPVAGVERQDARWVKRQRRELRGDLDNILAKALKKSPAARYVSAAAFADDLRRWLNQEPVAARPDTIKYRVGKFVRRHRIGVMAAAVICVALLAGIVGTTTGLVRARRAEAAARAEETKSARVAAFLSGMLSDVDPIGMGRTLRASLLDEMTRQGTLRGERTAAAMHLDDLSLEAVNTVDVARRLLEEEILRKAVRKVEAELAEEPALASEIYHAVGSSYFNLQLYGPAGETFTRAAELCEQTLGADSEKRIHLLGDIGDSYRRAGRYREAEPIYRDGLAVSRRVLGDEAKQTLLILNALGDDLRLQARDAEAEPLLREALERLTRSLGPDDEETLKAGNNLALVLRDQERFDEAEPLLRQTIERMKRSLGSENPQTINSEKNLATVILGSGRAAEAEALLKYAMEKSHRVLGDEGWHTLTIRRHLANAYFAQGRLEESEALMRDNLLKLKTTLGERHSETIGQLRELATLLVARERTDESVPLLVDALARYKATFGDGYPGTLITANLLASAYERLGRRREAEDLFLATARSLGEGRQKNLDRVYAEAAYHLARLGAVRGARPAALDWLKMSLDAGLESLDRVSSDEDLKSLYGPEFDALLARARTP